MIFVVKPRFMTSLKGGLHRKIKEVTARVSLDAYTTDNLPLSSARLILQEEILFERREISMYRKEDFAQMDKDDNLEDGVRVEMH
jgi:hypothetical protein